MTQEQLARIHLLSSRFHQLQGLRIALFGATLTFSQFAGLFISSNPPALAGGVMFVVALVLASPGFYRLNRYYDETFGRQVRTPASTRQAWMILGAFVGVRVIFGESISGPVATLVLVSAMALWVAMKDWPWRGYYLLVPMAGGLALAATSASLGLIDTSKTLTALYLTLGIVMMPIGMLDHRLLVTLVQESRRAGAVVIADRASVGE